MWAAAAIFALPTLFGAHYWMLDNLTSFSLQLLGVVVALIVVASACRMKWTALLGLGLAIVLGWRIYPHIAPPEQRVTPALTWLVANVLTSNPNRDELLALIQERKPDIVGLVETDAAWLDDLDGPLREYSYRILHPRDDNFGMALYSRKPLVNPQVQDSSAVPTIAATVKMDAREIDLVLVHVLPPVSKSYTNTRNEQLARMGALGVSSERGLVVAGDFNATPYSAAFRHSFSRDHFRRLGGVSGTFPAGMPGIFRIPIDHVLISGAVQGRQEIERPIGSDHLPFVIELW